ncbi:MAG: PAS domain-containing protein [Magnetococcales bacterium]|nr:PAS domain-containing protein [Magnetococcales bacterium]
MAVTEYKSRAEDKKIKGTVVLAFGLLGLVTAIGVVAAFNYVDQERQRALQQWQVQLGIVVDSRVQAVEDWVASQSEIIENIANNQSLKIYLSEFADTQWDRSSVTDEAAQAGYLGNLLVVTSERHGFSPPPTKSTALANVEEPLGGGIVVIAGNGERVAGSGGVPLNENIVAAAWRRALTGEKVFIDQFKTPDGTTAFGFAAPIYGIQDDLKGPGLGVVVGIKPVDKELFSLLKQPGDSTATAESFLIRKHDYTLSYLSPLRNGLGPLDLELDLATPQLASGFVFEKNGGFGLRRDYGGREVLVTSRKVKGTPWRLVRTISRDEALAETESRHNTTLIAFLLLIAGITVTIIAVWRHGTSVRAAQSATKYKIAAERFENLIQFLRVMTDSQPTQIIALDIEGRYTFANMAAANSVGLHPRDMMGKTMYTVAGPVKAGALAAVNGKVFKDKKMLTTVHKFAVDDAETIIKSSHTFLPANLDHPETVLVVMDDITELSQEQEKAGQRLMQLVETLVGVVDRRDPFSANHSSRVGEVSQAIGKEMGLPAKEIAVCELAGRLMSLGKIYIPTEILTKVDKLSPDEQKLLAGSIQVSADMVENVDFEGPVVATIRQLAETWDGQGPLGLVGEQILRSARIVSVANTFVGMVSPRAYRNALTFEVASSNLISQAGKQYDRKAVLALVNYLENRNGKTVWAHYNKK